MSSVTAQVSFAAELITMLVAVSGLMLMIRSSELADRARNGRFLLAAGLAVLGVGAFLHGSLLIASTPSVELAVSRIVGVALLLLGSVTGGSRRWPVYPRQRILLTGGALIIAGAAVAEVAHSPEAPSAVVLGIGALVLGVVLVGAGRRAIATRVAVASAGTLILVLVIVAVAMSQTITSSVTSSDLARLAQRARTEGYLAAGQASQAEKDARFAASIGLTDYFRSAMPNPLVGLSDPAEERNSEYQSAVQNQLNAIASLYQVAHGGFAYALPKTRLVLTTEGLPAAIAQRIATIPGITDVSCPNGGAGRILVNGGAVWAIGTFPECSATNQVMGTVIDLIPLDADYLNSQTASDPAAALALVADAQTLASSRGLPGPDVVAGWAGPTARSGASSARVVGGHFVGVQPVATSLSGRAHLAMVAASSGSALTSTRQKLFRTLFLIALGTTLAALALAVLVGERITLGLRRLTEAVRRVEASGGTTLPRAGALGHDEVGELATAFDTMIDSVEEHAAALRAAVDDETRLRNRLEAVVAGISDSLVAIDVDGRIIELNAAAERLFGVHAGAVRGEPVGSVVTGRSEDGRSLGDQIGRPRPQGWGALATIVTTEGVQIPVAISAGAVRGPAGELIGAVLILRDLRSEQELERMKTEFLSRVGHELRTPLTGIMGYADILLRRDVDPERTRAWHGEILSGAKKLLRIVEMLEFFASAGAGRVRLRPELLDVGSLASGLQAKWSGNASPNHQIVKRVEPGTPTVRADRRWLVMALDELLDNATKFSPNGGRIVIAAGPVHDDNGPGAVAAQFLADLGGDGRVTVAERERSAAADRARSVEISVIDHGDGMSPEEQARAFGDFVQLDESDTRRYGGLGLGLALVKRVIEGHGGSVAIRSTPGRGTALTVRLPVEDTTD